MGLTTYGFGFNGQERSPEVSSNSFTAEYWQYDARIGRRWNIDPILKAYESPFMAFGGNPISSMDPDGADTIDIKNTTTRTKLRGFSDGHSDNLVTKSRTIVTQSGEIIIKKADGEDVFRITNTIIDIDENGSEKSSSSTTTLELNDPRSFYLKGGNNLAGFVDDRYALASYAPRWLLSHYDQKTGGDIGIRTAIAYQKDMAALPYISASVGVAEIVFTGGLSGWFSPGSVVGFNSMSNFTKVYGKAPNGFNWHHFVEQRLAKNGTFQPQLIYSTENSVLIQSGANSPHSAISAYYSRVLSFTEGKTLRKWLEGKSFQEQLKFGKDVYNKVMSNQSLRQ